MTADKVKENGWRQGSIIPEQAIPNNFVTQVYHAELPSEQRFYIVISHDCDVSHNNYKDEPFVEVIVANKKDEENKSIFYGHSKRKIQLEAENKLGKIILEFNINNTFKMQRQFLENCIPDTSIKLSKENVTELALWCARRYTRKAFPDKFNTFTRNANNELRKNFKKAVNNDVKLLSGIYILSEDQELDEYHIKIYATVQKENYYNPPNRAKAKSVLNLIEKHLSSCPNITIAKDSSELVSEDNFPIHNLRFLKRWDFDDLSIRSGDYGDIDNIIS